MTSEEIMNALVRIEDVKDKHDYFHLCQSVATTHPIDARDLFKKLPKVYKRELIEYLRTMDATESIINFYDDLFK